MSFDFKIVRKGPVILTCNEFHQSQPNIKFSMNALTEFQVKLINSSQRKTQKPWVHRTNLLTEMAIPMFSTNSAVMQGTKHYFTSRRINILCVNNVLISHKTWNVSINAADKTGPCRLSVKLGNTVLTKKYYDQSVSDVSIWSRMISINVMATFPVLPYKSKRWKSANGKPLRNRGKSSSFVLKVQKIAKPLVGARLSVS